MPETEDSRQQAQEVRAMAVRARRLARDMAEGADRNRLLCYAEELEERARRLDVQAPTRPRVVAQTQQQVQQQGPVGAGKPTSGGKT